jgi:hypothetical protein
MGVSAPVWESSSLSARVSIIDSSWTVRPTLLVGKEQVNQLNSLQRVFGCRSMLDTPPIGGGF